MAISNLFKIKPDILLITAILLLLACIYFALLEILTLQYIKTFEDKSPLEVPPFLNAKDMIINGEAIEKYME